MIARLGITAIFIAILASPSVVSAHVLITDDSQSHGAVLHIMPDDDPVAGEQSTIFFDTQGDILSRNGSTITGYVQQAGGAQELINIKTDGALATATVVFPEQGTYTLGFTVTLAEDNESYTFTKVQRVTRGLAGAANTQARHAWAETLAIGSASALVALGIVAFNRRKLISSR